MSGYFSLFRPAVSKKSSDSFSPEGKENAKLPDKSSNEISSNKNTDSPVFNVVPKQQKGSLTKIKSEGDRRNIAAELVLNSSTESQVWFWILLVLLLF